jgi:hypothetical protein
MENVCEIVWLTSYKLMFDSFLLRKLSTVEAKVKETPQCLSLLSKREIWKHIYVYSVVLLTWIALL